MKISFEVQRCIAGEAMIGSGELLFVFYVSKTFQNHFLREVLSNFQRDGNISNDSFRVPKIFRRSGNIYTSSSTIPPISEKKSNLHS